MSERIEVSPHGPGAYAVAVTEGTETTHHVVAVPDELLGDLGVPADEAPRLVTESFKFLLEREPATSILGTFSLEQISDYFPEYREQIRLRVAG